MNEITKFPTRIRPVSDACQRAVPGSVIQLIAQRQQREAQKQPSHPGPWYVVHRGFGDVRITNQPPSKRMCRAFADIAEADAYADRIWLRWKAIREGVTLGLVFAVILFSGAGIDQLLGLAP